MHEYNLKMLLVYAFFEIPQEIMILHNNLFVLNMKMILLISNTHERDLPVALFVLCFTSKSVQCDVPVYCI